VAYTADKHELIFIQNVKAQHVLHGKETGTLCTAYAMMSANNVNITEHILGIWTLHTS
jgi:hypothetical protein